MIRVLAEAVTSINAVADVQFDQAVRIASGLEA